MMRIKDYAVIALALSAGTAIAQGAPETVEANDVREVRDLQDRGAALLEDESKHRMKIQALERQIAIAEREKRLEMERKAKRDAEEKEDEPSGMGARRTDSTTRVAPPPMPPAAQNRNFAVPPPPPTPKSAPNLAGVVGNMAVFTVGKALIRARAGEVVDGFRVDMVTPSEVILSRDNNGERDETRISLEF